MSDNLPLTRDGAVTVLTIDRPEKRNAMTRAMWQALPARMAEAAGDPATRAIVLQGAGGKAFCPGNDIAEFETERATPEAARRYVADLCDALDAVWHCPLPTVAAIDGACMGSGLMLAASCDLRIAAPSAQFSVPIKRLALAMARREFDCLARLCDARTALEMMLEGRVFAAGEAVAKGLVSRIADDPREEAMAAATRIAEGAPLTARLHKKMARGGFGSDGQAEDAAIYASYGTQDAAEGRRAFAEKRAPVFKGS